MVLKYRDLNILVETKKVKNINISIRKNLIRISKPKNVTMEYLKKVVDLKYDWIVKQSEKFNNKKTVVEKLTDNEYILVGGLKYLINIIISNKNYIEVDNFTLYIHVKDNNNETVEKLLDKFYRKCLIEKIPHYMNKWAKIINVQPSSYGIRKMKTRWGSCNITSRKIWISLNLAKLSDNLLEYVVIHELLHLKERYHNNNFYKLMQLYVPDYKSYDQELNKIIF